MGADFSAFNCFYIAVILYILYIIKKVLPYRGDFCAFSIFMKITMFSAVLHLDTLRGKRVEVG